MNTKIAIITIAPNAPSGVKVLSPSPYMLTSYLNWRCENEGIVNYSIDPMVFESFETDELISNTLLNKQYDVVAFSLYVWNVVELIKVAQLIKLKSPKTIIIFGGPQVSPVAEEVIAEYEFLDIIPYVTIPGEIIFFNIIKAILLNHSLETVPNIFYRTNHEIKKTQETKEKLDFESIPSPYLDGTIKFETDKKYLTIIESSRGCPFDCAYCFWGTGSRKMNYYPTDKTIQEIALIYSNPSVVEVYFADSDFLIQPTRAVDILKAIIKYGGTRVLSSFEIDSSQIKENKQEAILLLSQLPDCKINYAIQTTTPKALDLIGHRAGKEKFKRSAELVRTWVPNIEMYVDTILPLPGDTLEGFYKTLDFAMELKPTRITVNYPLFLLPGTSYFEHKDSLGMQYTAAPNYNVIETKDFPKKDVAIAFKLGVWVLSLTYYLPNIAKFFYAISENSIANERIQRMRNWIRAIERELPIFENNDNLIDELTQSVTVLNNIKGSALTKICKPKSVSKILEVIIHIEKDANFLLLEDLKNDLKIFEEINKYSVNEMDPYKEFLNGIQIGSEQINLSNKLPRFHFHNK